MITGELKNKIDSLWDIFAAGGLVNPLDVMEQSTSTVQALTADRFISSIRLLSILFTTA